MQEVVLVKIREGEKIAYFSVKDLPVKKLKIGDYVIIEAERGKDYGQVIADPELVPEAEVEAPLRKVVRVTSRDDLRQIQENKKKTKEAMDICTKKIEEHKLNMKLVDAEYSFDRSKFIFYFILQLLDIGNL